MTKRTFISANHVYGVKTTSEASVRKKWLPIVIVNDASQDITSSNRSISDEPICGANEEQF